MAEQNQNQTEQVCVFNPSNEGEAKVCGQASGQHRFCQEHYQQYKNNRPERSCQYKSDEGMCEVKTTFKFCKEHQEMIKQKYQDSGVESHQCAFMKFGGKQCTSKTQHKFCQFHYKKLESRRQNQPQDDQRDD
jgi:hypothetical protein